MIPGYSTYINQNKLKTKNMLHLPTLSLLTMHIIQHTRFDASWSYQSFCTAVYVYSTQNNRPLFAWFSGYAYMYIVQCTKYSQTGLEWKKTSTPTHAILADLGYLHTLMHVYLVICGSKEEEKVWVMLPGTDAMMVIHPAGPLTHWPHTGPQWINTCNGIYLNVSGMW